MAHLPLLTYGNLRCCLYYLNHLIALVCIPYPFPTSVKLLHANTTHALIVKIWTAVEQHPNNYIKSADLSQNQKKTVSEN